MFRKFISTTAAALCLLGCAGQKSFSKEEIALIKEGADNGLMRVLTIDNPADNAILRMPSQDLSEEVLKSEEYAELCSLMVATVTHPSQDGVGIAGPQVGLNRRVVAVQRFDKDGEPFEVYPNISIVWASDSLAPGAEGCLSVPDRRGEVMRSTEIVIEYDVLEGVAGKVTGIKTVQETISGFTAVIFQHEIDHLDGILYIDRL